MGVLAAYRCRGADLPLQDRWAPHGVGVEGWYWRAVDPAAGRVVAVMLGVARASDGSATGSVVIAATPGGLVREATTTDVELAPGQLRLGGLATATRDGVRAAVGDLTVALALDGAAPLAPRLRGGLGPAHLVPGFPQYWEPVATAATARIEAELDGSAWRGAARAYHEKNWGGGFPAGGWWWGAAHAFPEPRAAVAFAGGPLLAAVPLAPTAVVVRLPDGRCVRLGTPGLSGVRAAVGDGTWRLDGRGPRHRVVVDAVAPADDPGLLLAHPEPSGALERRARQHLAGTLRVAVEERRGGRLRALWTGTSAHVGLERGEPAPAAQPSRR